MADRFGESETPLVRPRRRRRWRYVVALLALFVFLVVAAYFYRTLSAETEVRAAIAEADQLDPRWRFEELESDRAVVPDAENSATTVTAAKQLLPDYWPYWEFWSGPRDGQDPPDAAQRMALDKSFSDLEPQRQINDEQALALRKETARAALAVAEARKLVDLTEGRYPITYSSDAIFTPRLALSDARTVTHLLSLDALLRAHDNAADAALESCQAALNAARSIGDEPLLVALLVCLGCRGVPVGQAERVLAQGEPSEATLRRFQVLLEKEESEPLVLNALRGERARADRFMEGLASGTVKLSDAAVQVYANIANEDARMFARRLDLIAWTPGAGNFQRAAMLRYMDSAVEVAKLPPGKWHAEFRKCDAAAKVQPYLVGLLAPAYLEKISGSYQRSQAYMRCAIVAIAAERYRRSCGRWPDTLDDPSMTPFLRQAPADPFDGLPLRWRRLDDGAEVYSIGPDSEDNGGKLDRQNPIAPGTDMGIRLWDPAKRRQPPAAPKPVPGPG